VQDVLKAFAEPGLDYDLNIVGTGPYLDTLIDLDSRLGTNAKFHGWLDNDSRELQELLETAAIFVFPSHAENFPLVLLEAMAAGTAIITTDQTGCREVVGDTALQVPPGNPGAIREALDRLVSDKDLRETLGRSAFRRVQDHFGWPTIANRYILTFRELLADSRQALSD